MRLLYAIAGMMAFLLIMVCACEVETLEAVINDNVLFLSLAVIFAGGLAGGR